MSYQVIRTYNGAVAVVTGAASGIGRCLAEELAKRGSEVILADVQIELAEEVASGIRATGGNAQSFRVDVTNAYEVDMLLRKTVERTGRLDYLFNNAGISIDGPIEKHTLEDWQRIIDINFRGVVHGVHSVYPIMQHQGFGHIVNSASIAGLIPSSGMVAYTATKHAVMGLSTALRAEAAVAGIRVSVLCPGLIRTAILEGGGKYGKSYAEAMTVNQQRKMIEQSMPPDQFARQALNAIARNKAIIVIPAWWKLFWWVNRLSPNVMMLLMQKMMKAKKPSHYERAE